MAEGARQPDSQEPGRQDQPDKPTASGKAEPRRKGLARAHVVVAIVAVFLLLFALSTHVSASRGFGFVGSRSASGPSSYQAADSGFTITDLNLAGTWHEDNTVSVTQVITVDFSAPHDGLRMLIPTSYDVPASPRGLTSGMPARYTADVHDITVNGKPYWTGTANPTMVQLSTDQGLSGTKTYTVSYTYVLPYDYFPEGGYVLYLPMLDASWDVPIQHLSFRVDFDRPLPQSSQQSLHMYSGNAGSEEDALGIQLQAAEGSVQGQATGLDIKQQVALVGNVPRDYFVMRHVQPTATDVPTASLVCVATAVALALYILARTALSRRRAVTPVPTCRPPQGISPAQAAVIVRSSADQMDPICLIPWWANRGYVSITRRKSEYGCPRLTITKVRPLPTNRPKFESNFFAALFKDGDTVTLPMRNEDAADPFDAELTSAQRQLDDFFRSEHPLQTNTAAAWGLGLLPSLAFVLAFWFSTEVAFAGSILWSIVLFVAFLAIMLTIMRASWRGHATGKVGQRAVTTVVLAILAFLVIKGWVQDATMVPWPEWLAWVGLAACLAASACFPCLMVDTPYCQQRLGELLGLRDFIRTAEAAKLQEQLKKDKLYYFTILPYAMAFGLETSWYNRWDGLPTGMPEWHSAPDAGGDAAQKNPALPKYVGIALREAVRTTIECTTRRRA